MKAAVSKEELRKLMLNKLRKQKEEWFKKKSLAIKEKLFRLKVFKQAKTIMLYCALNTEVQTRLIIEEAFKFGKKVVVPTCNIKAKKIIPCMITGLEARHFKQGPHFIDEPCGKKPVRLETIDLCIVPGLAFDKKGNRLGRGLGYYDRFLSLLPESVPKIGLAFKLQVLSGLPQSLPHDVRVDKVIFA